MGDTFFNPDPDDRPSVLSDTFVNTRYLIGGDVWFDVIDESFEETSWDILNVFLQTTAWEILNENFQDTAWDIPLAFSVISAWNILNQLDAPVTWSIFARVLYYMQQFWVKAICFDCNIRMPVDYNFQVLEPLEFTFYPTSELTDTINLAGLSLDTIVMDTPTQFGFQIMEPLTWTFNVDRVIFGSEDTENRRAE